jgi:hypothetical protein
MSIYAWGNIYRFSYYVLIGSLLIGGLTTWLTFVASNRISADLTNRLAVATKTAGEANERAGYLEKEAAAARLETARIKERIAWREISPEQAKSITAALASAPPDITLWHLSTDPESTNLYLQLKAAFVEAGVKFGEDDDRQLISSGLPRYGVLLSGRQPELERMKRALERAGIMVTAADIKDDAMNVWVGNKPRPK